MTDKQREFEKWVRKELNMTYIVVVILSATSFLDRCACARRFEKLEARAALASKGE